MLGSAAVALPLGEFCSAALLYKTADLHDIALEELGIPYSWRLIGTHYLSEHSIQEAFNLIGGLAARRSAFGDRRFFKKNLVNAIRNDFSEGRIRLLDSWILSETELAICVTLALESRTRHR
jgi:hypothetical protein